MADEPQGSRGDFWIGLGLAFLLPLLGRIFLGPRFFSIWVIVPLYALVLILALLVGRPGIAKGMLTWFVIGLIIVISLLFLLLVMCFSGVWKW